MFRSYSFLGEYSSIATEPDRFILLNINNRNDHIRESMTQVLYDQSNGYGHRDWPVPSLCNVWDINLLEQVQTHD
ncbi:unnamed protein product [Pieris brassicae]|uniref:Uncharacterized protein n=1 Tax=Pieris brassicae TaxID=7116 RepID=A0A9P0TP26_PIEBR|nr:unnamed protein product [Pieris brassicae]